VFLAEVQAAGRSVATQRSYALDVLRWLRFCWAMEVPWDQATSWEARDFIRWMMSAAKPARPHWRTGQAARASAVAPGSANPVTGKKAPGRGYAASTVAHCESVLRAFYDIHLEAGTGVVNPFPLARRPGRAAAHRSPMDPVPDERAAQQATAGPTLRDGTVGPVWLGPGDLTTEHRDFVPQDHDLRVLVRLAAAEQRQPAEGPDQSQVEQAKDTNRDLAATSSSDQTAGRSSRDEF